MQVGYLRDILNRDNDLIRDASTIDIYYSHGKMSVVSFAERRSRIGQGVMATVAHM